MADESVELEILIFMLVFRSYKVSQRANNICVLLKVHVGIFGA